jgi:hypothetical protein
MGNKKPKIGLSMSLMIPEEKYSHTLLDFLSVTNVGRISAVVGRQTQSEKLMLFVAGYFVFCGEEESRHCFCMVQLD